MSTPEANTTLANTPLPEAIDGSKWKIRASSVASVSFPENTISVPLSASERDEFLRLHELGHVKWTPRDDLMRIAVEHSLPVECLQVAEDMRIHHNLAKSGMSTKLTGSMLPAETDLVIKRIMDQPNPVGQLTMMLAATHRTLDSDRLTRSCKEQKNAQVEACENAEAAKALSARYDYALRTSSDIVRGIQCCFDKHSLVAPFEATVQAAKLLRDLIAATPDQPPKPSATPTENGEIPDKAMMEYLREQAGRCTRDVPWGDCRIQTLPMVTTVAGAQLARRPRPHDTGAIPRFMHRLPIDGRVFGVRRRAPGGTILLDTSGSMDICPDDLDQLLTLAPCAMIAMYSGDHRKGTLSIIARNGSRADTDSIQREINSAGPGNIVDGPALLWLSRQEMPRVWICDGVVTGVYDQCSPVLTAEAMAVRRRGRITRFGSLPLAIDFFKKAVKGRRSL